MRRCRRCVLPDDFPRVRLDNEGVCNVCRSYKGKRDSSRLRREYKKKFESLARQYSGRNEYDILMCYSGGKDSTYTLSLLKDVYKLRILAFTFDNGFMPERTAVNIRNVVEKLGVDHIFFKPNFDILKKIFREAAKRALYPPKAIERASTICTSCMGLVKYLSLKTAIEKEIPLIAFGWSPGQAPVTSSVLKINPVMIKSMEKVIKEPLFRIIGRDIGAYFLNERHYARAEKFPIFIHPLAFHGYNEKKILEKIKKLGWEMPHGVELNATNCYLNPFADEVHIAKYHFHPYALEIAALVREGCMTREEGLKHMPVRKNQKIVKLAKKRLGLSRE
ncbi:MAG: hypothetical protein KKI13_03180 [Candidatus Omnitrophica bacterium]|nr:hypothetical protein [Candidatus Omnitrophota bacterium]MCG2704846.1 hypothetical protein [Candidatus Omnitrophota bacterium]